MLLYWPEVVGRLDKTQGFSKASDRETSLNSKSFEMRQRLSFLPSALPKVLIRRTYSSKSTPLINITDVKAPTGGGRIRILSLARPSARNAISRQLLWELRSHIDAVAGEYDGNGEEVSPQKRFGGAAGVDQKGPTRALILASEVSFSGCEYPKSSAHY